MEDPSGIVVVFAGGRQKRFLSLFFFLAASSIDDARLAFTASLPNSSLELNFCSIIAK